METLRQRLAEQKARHQGGSKWIGTAGTSPFGAYGYNPEGVRIGQGRREAATAARSRSGTGASSAISTTRSSSAPATSSWRCAGCASSPARAPNSSSTSPGTIRSTAHNAGWLDLKMVPERHNAVKLLLFLDVGGSMDDHVRVCEELFSAARGEFKHLVHFYFHNCLYDTVWKDSRRRHVEQTPVMEILRTYDAGHRVVLVGDASMSPYEIEKEGGSVERWNDEPGETWLRRLLDAYPRAVWLNPVPEKYWGGTDQHRHDPADRWRTGCSR